MGPPIIPTGRLHKQKVLEVYDEIVPNGKADFFVEQIFRIFDQDANGYLDFKVTAGLLCDTE